MDTSDNPLLAPGSSSPLESSTSRAALQIISTLRNAGFAAFFAGGCVRDLLLGLTPKDFDVATSATPPQICALFARTTEVGAHFGVILVSLEVEQRDVATEVATFRHDGVYLDGRRPDAVRFSSDPREDVLRRDFTINGMLMDPFAGSSAPAGQPSEDATPDSLLHHVLDFVGGRDDLAAHLVRTIGEPGRRFDEDKLRMLRAVRFAARLDFSVHPATADAIRRHAAEIARVSNERVRDELTRMLTEGRAAQSLEMLHSFGLLRHVLPEAERMVGVQQPPEFHPEGDVWVHTLLLLENLPAGCSPTLAWGMLLHDIGKPATFQPPDPARPGDRIRFNGHVEAGVRIAEVILARLRFSNQDSEQILSLIRNHMRFGDILHMKQSTLKRFLRLPRFEEHLALHRADCLSSHRKLQLHDFARQQFENHEPEEIHPRLLLTGRDLIAAGYPPSPQFKPMLELAEDAQLEGTVRTTQEALHLITHDFGPPPASPVSP